MFSPFRIGFLNLLCKHHFCAFSLFGTPFAFPWNVTPITSGARTMQRHILIVGPDGNTLVSLEFLLEAEGRRVSTVLGTADAITISNASNPADLLIFDAGRPGDNGMEALKRFAGRSMQSPAIVIASHP
jgi:PleD family two-component response regulator